LLDNGLLDNGLLDNGLSGTGRLKVGGGARDPGGGAGVAPGHRSGGVLGGILGHVRSAQQADQVSQAGLWKGLGHESDGLGQEHR
jgi:hypothetical protein